MKMLGRLIILLCLITGCGMTMPPPTSAMLNEVTAVNRYTGNGSTTAFTYSFRVLLKTDLQVLVDDTPKLVDTDYTVSGLGASGGGTVTFTVAPATATRVTLLRKQPVEQLSDYVPNEAFPAERVERDLDKLAMIAQQHKEALDRAIKLPKKSTLSGIDFPEPGADKFIKWNAAGTALEASTAGGGGGGGGFATDPTACTSGQYVTDQNELGTLTCSQVAFSQLSGTATDAQIPNTITVDLATLATTATALAANAANCPAGEAAGGVNAAGAAEDCFIPTVTTHSVLSATHTDTLAATVVLGDLLHGNGTPAWARLAGNLTATKQFLSQTGTGAISAVPAWSALVDSDIPDTITASNYLPLAGGTMTGKLITLLSGTGSAGVNLPVGVAPTSPVIGDIWNTGLTIQFRDNAGSPATRTLVDDTRSISTTSPLGGGGDLSSNRTVTCTTCTTNAAGLTVDQVVVGSTGQAVKILAAGTAGHVLTMSGGIAAWSSPGAPAGHDILSASHSDSAASAVVLGGLIYGNATPAWAQLSGNTTTTKKFLRQTGNGSISAAPAWDTIVAGDLPAGFVDAAADLAAGLCTDGQLLKKASGVWGCAADATGSGITTLNTLTADPQTFAVGTSGTDFAISSASSTHTFNLPSASASARGVVTTGSQTFGGTKTLPNLVLTGSAVALTLPGTWTAPPNLTSTPLRITGGVGTVGAPSTANETVIGVTRVSQNVAAVNPAFAASAGLAASSTANSMTVAVYGEAADLAGTLNGSFVEGGRFQGTLTAGTLGSAYGVIGVAGGGASIGYGGYLIAIEADVRQQSGSDAPSTFNRDRFAAGLVSGCDGTQTCDVAYVVNPYQTKSFVRGFYVPVGTVSGTSISSFEDRGTATSSIVIGGTHTTGIDLVGTFAGGYGIDFQNMVNGTQMRLRNNLPIVGRNAANSADVNIIQLGGDNFPLMSVGLGISGNPSKSVNPTGNTTATLTSFTMQANTVAANTREYLMNVGLTSATGSGGSGAGRDKVAIYSGIVANSGTGDVWAFNPLLTQSSGSGSYDAQVIEVDLNNNVGNRGESDGGGGLSAPVSYGVTITGAGSFRSTAALGIFGPGSAIWNRGIVLASGSVQQASFQDLTSATVSLDIRGSHTTGLDLSGGSFTNPIRLADNTGVCWDGTCSARLVYRTSDDNFLLLDSAGGCVKFKPNGTSTSFADC